MKHCESFKLGAVKVRFTQWDFRILRALQNLSKGKKWREKATLGSCFYTIMSLWVTFSLSTLYFRHLCLNIVLGHFRFVRTGRPDHCQSVWKWNRLFPKGFCGKKHLLHAYYSGFNWSGGIVLITSEVIIAMGMVWPVSSDRRRAPLNSKTGPLFFQNSTGAKTHSSFSERRQIARHGHF